MLLMSDELRSLIGDALERSDEPDQTQVEAQEPPTDDVTVRVKCEIRSVAFTSGRVRIEIAVDGDGRAETARIAQISRPERLWLDAGRSSFDCVCVVEGVKLTVGSPSGICVEAVPS
jgi:hypothetical protein